MNKGYSIENIDNERMSEWNRGQFQPFEGDHLPTGPNVQTDSQQAEPRDRKEIRTSNAQNVKHNTDSKRSLSEHLRTIIMRKHTFTYVQQQNQKIDTKSILYICLLLYLIEYLILFAFQLISYLLLRERWRDATWVTGVVLAIFYVFICLGIYFVQFKKNRTLLFILKFFEFGVHFVWLGWAVGYIDFSFMALSYIVIANVLLIFIWVG